MRKTVLVLDHDSATCEALTASMDARAFHVVCARCLQDALSLAREVEPAVFILDMMPTGKHGITVAAELREHGFGHTPMIAISASPTMLQAACLFDYFSAFFRTPLDLDELAEYVMTVTKTPG